MNNQYSNKVQTTRLLTAAASDTKRVKQSNITLHENAKSIFGEEYKICEKIWKVSLREKRGGGGVSARVNARIDASKQSDVF